MSVLRYAPTSHLSATKGTNLVDGEAVSRSGMTSVIVELISFQLASSVFTTTFFHDSMVEGYEVHAVNFLGWFGLHS